MNLEPRFWTTATGSFPHEKEYAALYDRLATSLDIPIWPQLVRRTFYENMYVQYSAALPGVVVDEANEKITFDTTGDLTDALETFYTPYLAEDVNAFGLLRQLERVTDKIRHVLDLALLVVVRQQNRVALLLQAMDALVQIQVD